MVRSQPVKPDFTAAARLDPGAAVEAVVTSIARAGVALGRSVFEPTVRPPEQARRAFGEDRGVQTILRAASNPAMTTTAGWAAELAHVMNYFLASLVGVSAAVELLGRGMRLRFDGAGTLSLPSIAVGAGAGFVGQGAPIPVVQFPTSAGVKLEDHKIALITSLTREMVESSSAESILRTTIAESASLGLDIALLSTTAGTVDRPPGLLNGVTPLTPSTTTPLSDAMVADLSALGGAVARVAGNEIIFVCAPEQALAVKLRSPNFPFSILASRALPAKSVVAVAAAALASAFDAMPEITATRESELVMDDAAPGAPGGTQPTMTLYQGDRIALRMRTRATWALRAQNAIAYMTAVSW
jgi:hypothetical protein